MRIKYGWDSEYPNPNHWNTRTPLHSGMPNFFHLYQDLNDKKLRVFLKKLSGRILDAGCGDGRFIPYADIGVDFSEGMLKRAKERHQNRGFIRASILNLPFIDKAFSVAFTVDVLLHIQPEKRKGALEELNRVAYDSYNFLAIHRTITPFILELFRTNPLKPLRRIVPYITVFFAFPFDRLKRLKTESASQVLREL